MHSNSCAVLALLIPSLLLLSPAFPSEDLLGLADPSQDRSPAEAIRARNEAVKRILKSSGEEVDPGTREKLKDLINDLIDFRELSRRALGKYWNERTEQEKTAFVDVFQQLIRNSSVKKLSIYRADRVEYKEPEIRGDEATVTSVAYKDRKSVEIVYKMHKVAGQWKVYDTVIDGASTARSYRDAFYKQIAETSYPETYAKLVRRLEEEKAEEARTATG